MASFVTLEAQASQGSYSIRSGDRVTVVVYTGFGQEYQPAGGERIVDREGEIFLPLIGPTQVSGLDQRQIRELLQEAYGKFYDDHVVQVAVELSVSVTGAVGNAGKYYVPPTASIVDAINEAGGMASELTAPGLVGLPADQSRVRLVRDGQTIVLNLRPDDVTFETQRMPIRSGDWIHVPNQARSRVRDELQFWGGILSFVANLAAIIVLISR